MAGLKFDLAWRQKLAKLWQRLFWMEMITFLMTFGRVLV